MSYVKNRETGEMMYLLERISGGMLVTKFDQQTGRPFMNSSLKSFISDEQVKLWEFSDYKIPARKGVDIDELRRFSRALCHALDSSGLLGESEDIKLLRDLDMGTSVFLSVLSSERISTAQQAQEFVNEAARHSIPEEVAHNIIYADKPFIDFLVAIKNPLKNLLNSVTSFE